MFKTVDKYFRSFFLVEEEIPEKVGLVYKPLDLDQAEKTLKLVENAEHDGEKGTPHASEKNVGSFEVKIYKYIETEINKTVQGFNENILYLKKQITLYDVRPHFEAAKNIDTLLEEQLKSIVAEQKDKLTDVKEKVENIAKDFNVFKSSNKLKREPDYPESKEIYVAVLLAILLLETILNGYYFAMGSELAYLGGIVQALGFAVVNLTIAFFLGRFTSFVNSINKLTRLYGYIFSALAVTWLFSFNLYIAHYRQQLETVIDGAEALAFKTIFESTFSLGNYWILFVIGLLFGCIACVEGYKWDDPYPGYGSLHRRLKQAQDDFNKVKAEIMVLPKKRLQEKIEELKNLGLKIKSSVGYLEDTVKEKHTLIKNLQKNIEQRESSSIFLIKRYREINRENRKTPAPKYFTEDIAHNNHPLENTEIDQDFNRVKQQQKLAESFDDMYQKKINSITILYNQSFDGIDQIDIDWNKDNSN
jgi:hypothetical protein